MIDIGANLTSQRFDKDLSQVIDNAKLAGVKSIIVTGTDLQNSLSAIDLCHQYKGLYATAGIHPHAASTFDATSYQQLAELLKSDKVVAVGETGLDFNRNFSTKEEQIYAFEQQIQLAIDSQKALFLHERDAFDSQYQILANVRKEISGGVIHCFTGSRAALEKYLELDLYIGITGWVCDERRGIELQSLVPLIPDNRLLIETDAPYLTPRTLTGKAKKAKNVPANLVHIAQFVAALREQSVEQLATFSSANATELFRL